MREIIWKVMAQAEAIVVARRATDIVRKIGKKAVEGGIIEYTGYELGKGTSTGQVAIQPNITIVTPNTNQAEKYGLNDIVAIISTVVVIRITNVVYTTTTVHPTTTTIIHTATTFRSTTIVVYHSNSGKLTLRKKKK